MSDVESYGPAAGSMGDAGLSVNLLVDIAEVVLRVAREIEPHGPAGVSGVVPLNGSEVLVMRWIHHNPGTCPAEGATATGLKRSNFSAVLRSLEAKDMVRRSPDPDDARSVRLYATRRAETSIARLHDFWRRRLTGALDQASADSSLSEAELLTARMVLERLSAGLRTAR
ncbi:MULTISPECIES: MarR family winged helix-turn-helix transcriptional regulator [Gordonia]|uniref:MarR family winged helix-turn-helix transcriptional regulator n=1 Tax=Gordonia TaxID=2053 RepID=UPI0032B3B7A9